ncbi:MAG: beta-galactosidase trimerization domain-containing protein [Fimbriimonadaceae bacterium]|nr:beta-galactosidase trimerization domain-containing protein [Fimbriimonadaceae bacterium]
MTAWLLSLSLLADPVGTADPYVEFLRSAPEWQAVPNTAERELGRWDTWLYMPWRYQWSIGTAAAGGRFCQEYGFNGGFTDHGEGPLEWLERYGLRFYNDHTAGKGYLYLRGANNRQQLNPDQHDARLLRHGSDGPQPLDAALLAKLQGLVRQRVGALRGSPQRVAYALDDELSSGIFVRPLAWRLTADDAGYAAWLQRLYGPDAPAPQWVTPDFLAAQYDRPLGQLDFSPLLDRLTWQDGLWAQFLGELVATSNSVDPATPCGFVGGQAPNLWGGYDYAKLLRKVQFVEAYNLGGAQAVIRSLAPRLPQVSTHFHSDQRGVANDIWQAWYYFAQGNRGMIGWVEGWFDGPTPRPWLREFAPTLRELGTVQGPKLAGATRRHDGIALYYSHPSLQVSWCLDAQAHGRTWVNRGNDHQLGTSHLVRRAWEDLLTDSDLQFDYLSYDQVALHGVPPAYRVLVLPACYALSNAEAAQIRAFAERGGTVLADFACGLFDQHGRARGAGALDDLFGVTHDGREAAADFFGPRLWVETDQDAGYSAPTMRALLETLPVTLRDGYAVAERRLPAGQPRTVGQGRAVYLNLSPQRYLMVRQEGPTTAAQRRPFVGEVLRAVQPTVTVAAAGRPERPRNAELVRWTKGDRTTLLLVQKAAVGGSSEAGNWALGLQAAAQPVTIRFARPVADLRNERTGEGYGTLQEVTLPSNPVEATMLSWAGD